MVLTTSSKPAQAGLHFECVAAPGYEPSMMYGKFSMKTLSVTVSDAPSALKIAPDSSRLQGPGRAPPAADRQASPERTDLEINAQPLWPLFQQEISHALGVEVQDVTKDKGLIHDLVAT